MSPEPEDTLASAPDRVICAACGHAAANGTIHCPHCCARTATPEARLRSGVRGALAGLAGGAALAVLALAAIGPERGSAGMAFGLSIAGLATGLTLGLARHRGGTGRR